MHFKSIFSKIDSIKKGPLIKSPLKSVYNSCTMLFLKPESPENQDLTQLCKALKRYELV